MDGRELQRERPELRDPHVPKFPVVVKEPTPRQVRDNINRSDVVQSAVVGVVSFPLGYLVARQLDRSLARPGMWFTGIFGTIGGAMLAYQNSSLRLQGFGRNDEEVARYSKREGASAN